MIYQVSLNKKNLKVKLIMTLNTVRVTLRVFTQTWEEEIGSNAKLSIFIFGLNISEAL